MVNQVVFPDPRLADDEGFVALGGDFRPETILTAYSPGIFPWTNPYHTSLWASPDPRVLLRPEELHVPRSLRKTLRRNGFAVTFDLAFDEVIQACAEQTRGPQAGTWITDELLAGFRQLHLAGLAHSTECWQGDRLVGGLYGLSLGAMYCGESMFYRVPDASKIAFVGLVERLQVWDFRFVDCQVHTEHVARFGARPCPREEFLDELAKALDQPTRSGPWTTPPAS